MPAGVVNHTIKPAVTRNGRVNQFTDRLDIRDIAGDEFRLARLRAQLASQRFAALPVTRAEDHPRAGVDERADATRADPLASAGDDYCLVLVIHAGKLNLLTAGCSRNRIRCSLPVTLSGSGRHCTTLKPVRQAFLSTHMTNFTETVWSLWLGAALLVSVGPDGANQSYARNGQKEVAVATPRVFLLDAM